MATIEAAKAGDIRPMPIVLPYSPSKAKAKPSKRMGGRWANALA
jgi:hypothetical protein